MRLSDLIGEDIVDASGGHLGRVHDVRLVQDAPAETGFGGRLRVQGLVIGRGGLASRLGYGRTGSRGPWLIRRLLESGNAASFVPWASVTGIDDDGIHVSGDAHDLQPVEPLARREEPAS
ncbi:MAG: hypothetical protein QOI56_763 [Actinomycetota bacterium]|jgi:hypothetical protein|nr:hypothetical protein [Actinomycetota bacterium]